MLDDVGIDPEVQLVDELALRALQVLECATADHLARSLVADPEHENAAALVREGDAVLDELLEVEVVLFASLNSRRSASTDPIQVRSFSSARSCFIRAASSTVGARSTPQ